MFRFLEISKNVASGSCLWLKSRPATGLPHAYTRAFRTRSIHYGGNPNLATFIVVRSFRTQSGRESYGLGSSRGQSEPANRVNEFYQDNKMQKLWDETFDRIAAFKSSPLRTRSSSGMTPPQSSRGAHDPVNNAFTGDTDTRNQNNAQNFSLDEQQLMKLSFAEGYFYGQENKKKAKFRFISVLREALIIIVIISIVYSITNADNVFKRSLLGRTFEIEAEEVDIGFNDVKGCDESKKELEDVVEFLKKPNKFSRLGCKLPKGVLLVGPPGTGKTLLARAVAGEAGVPFFHAAGSEFDEILVGQGARRVRDLFDRAKQKAPCVIFIDEIDSIGARRSSSMLQPFANQTINQLLSEMDGFQQNEGVIVVAATNRANDLDKALVRPGRFDVQVHVSVPDYRGRKELFELYLGKVRSAKDIDLDMLCRTTVGLTGADIKNLINQGALKAATDNLSMVTQDALEFARDKILMGPERRNRIPDEEQNRMTAFHEGGHALVAYYTEKANQLHKVTIVSRGNSLGHTSTMPDRDTYSQTREQLMATMDVMLGGRVAEELIYGADRVTTGCEDDLRKVNYLATKMVKDLGMSDKIGMRVVRDDNSQQSQVVLNSFPDATSELVETEISRLLDESKERVRKILTDHRNELNLLAETLLKYETLDFNEVKALIENGKDPKQSRQDKELERRNQKLGNQLKINNPKDRLPLNLLK